MSDLQKRIEEYVGAVVAEAPPLDPDTVARIAGSLSPPGVTPPPPPETRQQKELRAARGALNDVKAKFRRALEVCRVCELDQSTHTIRERQSVDMHAFQPLDVDYVMEVSERYRPQIREAEKRLREAELRPEL